MRPAGKARRLRILSIFEGGATQPDGMQREPNATRLRGRDTSIQLEPTRQWSLAIMSVRRAAQLARSPDATTTC
jgi:hypothetical protein